jgi:hypothetical protein
VPRTPPKETRRLVLVAALSVLYAEILWLSRLLAGFSARAVALDDTKEYRPRNLSPYQETPDRCKRLAFLFMFRAGRET